MENLDLLKIGLRKLRHYFYYEKNDLITRTQVLTFDEQNLHRVHAILVDPNKAKEFLDKISINLYPKSVSSKNEEVEKCSTNLFSNENLAGGAKIKEFLKMAYIPVELHLVSVVWLMKYGKILDNELSNNALGNRLDDIGESYVTENNTNGHNRKIFKNYIIQYNSWWRTAITTCKEQLEGNRDVTMINFDIKSFYNNVDFDFGEVENFINEKHPGKSIENDNVHLILKQIHQSYQKVYHNAIGEGKVKNKNTILPIGLLTSFVFANWYIKDIDKDILELDPVFYGRYVDDFIIVFQGRSLSKHKSVDEIIKSRLHTILSLNENSKEYVFHNRKTLSLKKEKTFVYKFNHKYPPSLLDKFINDQKIRSSEFRYLSDDEDENFDDFDKITFEQNFIPDDGNKARFKVLEENKFKMSSYFAKLITRRVNNGKEYKTEEIEKIFKFFKGYFLLKHYQFWEKLFAIFIVYEKYEILKSLIIEIEKEIKNCDVDEGLITYSIDYKRCMTEYLETALNQVTVLKSKKESEKFNGIYDEKYLVSLRSHYTMYPWLQYTKVAKKGDLDLTDRDVYSKHLWEIGDLDINPRQIPYRVKFYFAYMQEFYKKMYYKEYEQILKL